MERCKRAAGALHGVITLSHSASGLARISMAHVEEDMMENPFFQALQQRYADLYATASEQCHLICVPRKVCAVPVARSLTREQAGT